MNDLKMLNYPQKIILYLLKRDYEK